MDFFPFDYKREGGRKWIYGNKCIIQSPPIAGVSYLSKTGHFCGYVVLPKESIPKEWWGNYDAEGLSSLDIHRGITYCQIEKADNEVEIWNDNNKKLTELSNNSELRRKISDNDDPITAMKAGSKYFSTRNKIQEETRKALSVTNNGYVVFGFDCAHAGDEDRIELQNPAHIMMLTEKMEYQITSLAAVYEKYKRCNFEKRSQMVDEIILQANVRFNGIPG